MFDTASGGQVQWAFIAFFFAFYFVGYFLSTFFNACVIGCAMIRMDGGNPTVSDGLRTAGQNIGRILAWALVAATVGVILRSVQQRAGWLGRMILGAIGLVWTVATYFVVPVLVFEKVGPWAALKRSASILKGTWGEALIGNLGLGLVFFALGMLGLLAVVAGFALMTWTSVVAGIVVAFVYWLVLGIVYSAAQSVLVAALYRFAMTGKVSEEFAGMSFNNPWVM